MSSNDDDRFVSNRTQAMFQALVVRGANIEDLLALISSAYADGGNHVLDRLQRRMNSELRGL